MEMLVALKDGLKIFFHLELYPLLFGYVLLCSLVELFPTNHTQSYIRNSELPPKKNWSLQFAEIMLHIVATTLFVTILSPIFLRISSNAAWCYPINLIAKDPYIILKAFFVYLALAYFARFIPVSGLNRLIHNLVYGGIVLIYILIDFNRKGLVSVDGSLIVVPVNFNLVVLIIICIMSLSLGVFCTALAMPVSYKKGVIFIGLSYSIYAVSLFIPLFVYGAWLGNKLYIK
jgi:hypothetical protein